MVLIIQTALLLALAGIGLAYALIVLSIISFIIDWWKAFETRRKARKMALKFPVDWEG